MSAPDLYQITSSHNAKVAALNALQSARGRAAAHLCLIEGPHLFMEMRRARLTPSLVLYDPAAPSITPLLPDLQVLVDAGVEVYTASGTAIERASETRAPQGIVAALDLEALAPEMIRVRRRGRLRPLIMILDDITDPGNLGTIMRSALAADVDEILLTPHCVDPVSPKVLRAASGAHFHLPIRIEQQWEEMSALLAGDPPTHQVVLADADATIDYASLDLTIRTAIIIGNEAHGPSAPARRLATHPVRIPMYNDVESLNAAIAASVLLFESVRQRRQTEAQ